MVDRVDTAYYKVLLQKRNGNWEGIGFILPNSNSKVDFKNYVTNIDRVEEITGLDFFIELNKKNANAIEQKICTKCW